MSEFFKEFVDDQAGESSNEYGSVYLLVAVALFFVFVSMQGGLIVTVQTIASEFVNKLDSLSIANSDTNKSI
ncbi:MAG: hypothetical protein K2X93_20750 [Candidatus Obscuribacterales bacterium]|nr:hypothetical protein [Candidatus Obscuribacterales bacterium]